MAGTVATGPYCEVNQKGNGFRKTEALQMDALNGAGDNWEVLRGMEINICCFQLNRPGSKSGIGPRSSRFCMRSK